MADKKTKKPKKTMARIPISSALIESENEKELQNLEQYNLNSVPLLIMRDEVVFPHTHIRLSFERDISKEAIVSTAFSGGLAVIVTQKNPKIDTPTKVDEIYTVGTLVEIPPAVVRLNPRYIPIQTMGRAKLSQVYQTNPCFMAKVEPLFPTHNNFNYHQMAKLLNDLMMNFERLVAMGKEIDMPNFVQSLDGSSDNDLIDRFASVLNIPTADKQKLLEELDVFSRGKKVLEFLIQEIQIADVEHEVLSRAQNSMEKNLKESILRERMRVIQQELGDIDDEEKIADEYEQKLIKLKAPKEIKEKIKKELKHLRQLSPHNPETSYLQNWIETVFELPWGKRSADVLNIKSAEKILADSHYGLKEVKDRIIEYIAVLQLRQQNKIKSQTKPTILCFVGPPGVGKTSIGQSIAEAMGRKFSKISLGGIRDEAEIRGHRRTYVGAMPGRIIEGMKRAGRSNPVFMLDELDKLGADYKGDPAAALLEVLDPEQNHNFEDHYLDMPFDLSEVIFIATANTLDIPPALKDRLEIIHYSGYTVAEKLEIAKRYLWQKCLRANNLKSNQIKISDEMLLEIIEHYTKEAGVRSLERQISKLMRKVAREIVSHQAKKVEIKNSQQIVNYLGASVYDVSLAEEKDEVGVVTGLAWTAVGGDVLFVEAAKIKNGKGEIKLTGRLGEVMKESAQTALTYVKSHADELGIDLKEANKVDLHVHLPEGAVPKDGPSAGVTLVTAITSVLTNRPVKKEVAMTGEVTLRGKVLRIGGLKEKAIAAHRAGCTQIIIPADNVRDLDEMPQAVKDDLEFLPVKSVAEVLKIALK